MLAASSASLFSGYNEELKTLKQEILLQIDSLKKVKEIKRHRDKDIERVKNNFMSWLFFESRLHAYKKEIDSLPEVKELVEQLEKKKKKLIIEFKPTASEPPGSMPIKRKKLKERLRRFLKLLRLEKNLQKTT